MRNTLISLAVAILCYSFLAGPVAAQLPVTSGLAGWYDASEGVVDENGNPSVDGGRVRRWYSKHDPNIFLGSSGSYPWYETDIPTLNSQAAVNFRGNNTMWGQDGAWGNIPASTEYTVFAATGKWARGSLLRITGHDDAAYRGIEAVELNRSGEWFPSKWPIHMRYRDGSHWSLTPQTGYKINDSHTNLYEGHVVEAVFANTLDGAALLLDGKQIGQTRTDLADGLMHNVARNLQLGYASDEYGWMDGYVGEVIVYNRVLTPQERALVRDYLDDKYVVHPISPPAEPSSLLTLAGGLVGLAGFAIRRRR